jgi:hypothetical protein
MSLPIFDDEALQLLRAFLKVKDPSARKLIIALAEAAARGGTIKAYDVSEEKKPPKTH